MPSSRRCIEALLAALALAPAACDDRSAGRPPGAAPQPVAVPAPQGPAAAPPGHGARVFVDISESIRGFTSGTSVALQSLHAQVIDASLSALQLNNPFERCTVDTALHCASPGITPAQLRAPATYNGRDAALHLILRRPPQAPRADLQQPDALDPFAVTLIVTDGFSSTPAPFQPGASADVACTAGADPSCLAASLRRRVDEGYGVWVLRVVLPFDGRYFAERRLDAAMWSRVQAHVAEVNRDPAWNGVRFTAGTPSYTSESGAFRWTGARPLLVFVLSRDVPRARALVAEMQRRLTVERIGIRQSPADVAASEWAPFDGLSAMVTGAARNGSGGEADEVRVDAPSRSGGVFTVPVRCSIRGRSRIRLDGAVAFGALPPPRFAQVVLGWQVLSRPASELLVPREPLNPAPGAFTVNTGIDCRVLPAGRYAYDLGLAARWTVDPNALAAEWFVRESADTSYEMPEKVFGLADIARAVVADGVERSGLLDRVSLRVQRD